MPLEINIDVVIKIEDIPDDSAIAPGDKDGDDSLHEQSPTLPMEDAPAPDLDVPEPIAGGEPPPVLYVPYTRDVAEKGDSGPDARAVQRAIWAWARFERGQISGLDRDTVEMFKMPHKVADRRTPGEHVAVKVAAFRELMAIGDGSYDEVAHRALAPYFDQWGLFLQDTWHEEIDDDDTLELIHHAPPEYDEMHPVISGASPDAPKKPAGKKKPLKVRQMTQRKAIAAAAMLGYRNRIKIHYTMGPSRMSGVRYKKKPPQFGTWEDCSSFSTWCCWISGLPDPNGLKYNGTGYTGTLINNGRRIGIEQCTIGDLVFYGRGRISHVVVVVSQGRAIVSHGQESGPAYYSSPRYRSDVQYAHSYFRKS